MHSVLSRTATPMNDAADPRVLERPAPPGESRRPLVTVGLTCYKAERWIGECLDSLLAQTLQDIEIVISDNASPDGTYELCRRYAARDPRIRVFRNDHNVGIAGNMNRVFELARGDFFCWASANDWYAPAFLEKCVGRMQRDPELNLVASQVATFEFDRAAATADMRSVDGSMAHGHERVVSMLSLRDGRMFRGVYRVSALRPRMPLSSRFGQDTMLVAQMSAHGKVAMLDEPPHYFERCAPGAVTHKIPAHLRVGYYEPKDGLRAYVFHRTRNQLELWSIALRHAHGGCAKRDAVLGMLGVSWRWKSDVYHDLYDIAGLVRGYLRAWLQRRR